MTCPHGVSTARSEAWWSKEDKRAASGPRPHTSSCACCGGPFQSLPGFETERCPHCLVVEARQYEMTA